MNEKIGLQDLVVLLAEKANITKKDAETLVKECFDTMIEGLLEDKLLKIRNLGTFKLVQVEDRESVDVSTGERVLIPAHYKVTFSPDTELAETVNAPYASLETVELTENEVLEKSEDEIDDETDDDDNEKIWLKSEIEEKPEEPQAIEIKQEQDELEIEKPEAKKTVYETPPVYKNTNDEPDEPDYSEQYDEEYRPIGATNGLFWLFFLVAAGLILFFTGQYFCPIIGNGGRRPVIPDSVIVFSYSVNKPQVPDSLKTKVKKPDPTVLRVTSTPKTQSSNTPVEQPSKAQVSAPAKTEPATATPKVQPATAPKIQTADNQSAKTYAGKKYTVHRGERLNTIALREYGHKAFWVYIYDENRNAIRNPDLIEPGMVINIPPAGKYGIDKNNQESVNRALELERKYKP